jgi:hypothetical protein
MSDMLHILTIATLVASAWLVSRAAAFVARKVARPAQRGGRRNGRGEDRQRQAT